jgi:hypothetical protein
MGQHLKCFNRMYGVTLVSLAAIAIVCGLRLKWVYVRSTKRRESKFK